MSKLRNKIAKGTKWSAIAFAFTIVSRLAVTMIMSRLLLPKEFGVVGACLIVVDLSQSISEFGFLSALINKKDFTNKHIKTTLATVLFMSFMFSFLIFISSNLIEKWMGIESLGTCLRYSTLLFIIRGISSTSRALLRKEIEFKFLALAEPLSFTLGYGLVSIILAFLKFGPMSIIYGTLSQYLLMAMFVMIKKPMNFPIRIYKEEFIELFKYGFGDILSRIFNFFGKQGDKIIIGKMLGAESLGLFSRGSHVLNFPTVMFNKIIAEVLFPSLSQIRDNVELMKKSLFQMILTVTMITFPAILVLMLFSKLIITLILGSNWLSIKETFMILSLGIIFRLMFNITYLIKRSLGLVFKIAKNQLIFAITLSIFSYIGCLMADIKYVAIGVTLALVQQMGGQLIISSRGLKINLNEWAPIIFILIVYIIISTSLNLTIYFYLNRINEIISLSVILVNSILIGFVFFKKTQILHVR